MKEPLDLHGVRFGRLVGVQLSHRDKSRKVHWLCQCDCGGTTVARTNDLRRGAIRSCGCMQKEFHAQTHGYAKRGQRVAEYNVWLLMRDRCRNPKNKRFDRYGGRGISVCGRWNDFAAFYADMGARPTPQHSIDRIDNDGNYEPRNCRWATSSQQRLNQSRAKRSEVNEDHQCI